MIAERSLGYDERFSSDGGPVTVVPD